MTTRSSRSAKQLGIATLLSFTLIAAACGGGSDDATPSSEAPPATEGSSGTEAPPATEATDAGPESTAVEGAIDQEDVVVDDEGDEGPAQGGTLRYGLEADVNGINPTSSSLSSPGLMMSNAVFDTLSVYTPDGEAVPYLAESFTPNDDFTQWQVKATRGHLLPRRHAAECRSRADQLRGAEGGSTGRSRGQAVLPRRGCNGDRRRADDPVQSPRAERLLPRRTRHPARLRWPHRRGSPPRSTTRP